MIIWKPFCGIETLLFGESKHNEFLIEVMNDKVLLHDYANNRYFKSDTVVGAGMIAERISNGHEPKGKRCWDIQQTSIKGVKKMFNEIIWS